MAAPTAQDCAKDILGFWGITSLDPADTTTTAVQITPTDRQNICTVLTQALQIVWNEGPSEAKNAAGSGFLHEPRNVTLDAVLGSTTIANFTTFDASMVGCTIRISTDPGDNELLSATKLARPYNGTSAVGIPSVIYGDCVVIDDSIEVINAPLLGQDGFQMIPAFTRDEFLRLGQWPAITDYVGNMSVGWPFYFYNNKPISVRPYTYFVDGAYDSTLSYVPRKLRFSPMPASHQTFSYSALMNSPRIVVADIYNGSNPLTDPGTPIPIPSGRVETIFLPIARQLASGMPQFHNKETLPQLSAAYRQALGYLKDIKSQGGNRSIGIR